MQQRASFAAAFIGVGIAVGIVGAQLITPHANDDQFRQFLLDNPEVIMEAVAGLEQREEAARREAAQTAVRSNLAALQAPEGAFVAGNPNGDVTVVEFFDYNCPYCRRATPGLLALIEEDPNLRVVFFELPILSDTSHYAAKASLASAEQGRYMEFHAALMNADGRLTEDRVLATAIELGLDMDKLQADMNSERIHRIVEENVALARSMQVNGTPTFVVGDELTVGWSTEQMRALIAAKREQS